MAIPETRYARSGEVNIAYQVVGDGPFDLVLVPGFVSNVELSWDVPVLAKYLRELASFGRLILFDKRGTGLSDRDVGIPDLETRMDDVRAVMDAARSERAALLGSSEGGPMSLLFAATYPERAWALVLFGSFPRVRWAPDYSFGDRDEELTRSTEEEVRGWTDPQHVRSIVTEVLIPGGDDESTQRLATLLRSAASPRAIEALSRMNNQIDVRGVLPAIRVPTLVLVRKDDDPLNVAGSRYMAERISGARYVELPGRAHAAYGGDSAPVVSEIEQFLQRAWDDTTLSEEPDRVLATVLFTDIVGSTAKAAELGDARWGALLRTHHDQIRRQLARFRGVEINTTGDGFVARFDGPARAVRCACAIVDSVRELGIEVRAGLHTGECEVIDGSMGGIAVHIGARVAERAGPSEVLVSGTVKDLVVGSGLSFADRGVAELKGVPGNWALFAVVV